MPKKIKNCPNCDSPRIAKIVYGYPNYDDKMAEDISEEEIVLGGCCVTEDDPDFQCIECQALIYSKTGKFILNDEDEY
jgi:hypothetical protein